MKKPGRKRSPEREYLMVQIWAVGAQPAQQLQTASATARLPERCRAAADPGLRTEGAK